MNLSLEAPSRNVVEAVCMGLDCIELPVMFASGKGDQLPMLEHALEARAYFLLNPSLLAVGLGVVSLLVIWGWLHKQITKGRKARKASHKRRIKQDYPGHGEMHVLIGGKR